MNGSGVVVADDDDYENEVLNSTSSYGATTLLSDVTNNVQPMSKRVKLLKTSCMMFIYLGMVKKKEILFCLFILCFF